MKIICFIAAKDSYNIKNNVQSLISYLTDFEKNKHLCNQVLPPPSPTINKFLIAGVCVCLCVCIHVYAVTHFTHTWNNFNENKYTHFSIETRKNI